MEMAPDGPLRPLKGDDGSLPLPAISPWIAYKLRWKRRRLLWRCLKSRHDLTLCADRTQNIQPGNVLLIATLRNETLRLPHFMRHYRDLGVRHFLLIDNDSDDGSREFLSDQPDVSLWTTKSSYRASRFGVDWAGWLRIRYGHGHWCLTVDVDELLIYSGMDHLNLSDLSRRLDARGMAGFGALMIELFPKGPVGAAAYSPAQEPTEVLSWFDSAGYRSKRQYPMGNLWVQGGPRDRSFFLNDPRRAPTLNKIPFVRWNRRIAYVNSTHSLLPRSLNTLYDGPGDERPHGALLHTKFLADVVERAKVEKTRKEHFHSPDAFANYYDQLQANPDFWHGQATRYESVDQLAALGLAGPEA